MSEGGRLEPPPTRLLDGDEPIAGTTATVRDFWAWCLSDLRTNTVRPMLAEFIVAQALGAESRPRIEWAAFDVLTPEKVRVEVKSSAYVQAWVQPRPSAISFGGLNSRTWSDGVGPAASATYNADVYVFALVIAQDHASYDPLDVTQWSFWVLPRQVVEATGQKSLALSRVSALAGAPVAYGELAGAVSAAAGRGRDAGA